MIGFNLLTLIFCDNLIHNLEILGSLHLNQIKLLLCSSQFLVEWLVIILVLLIVTRQPTSPILKETPKLCPVEKNKLDPSTDKKFAAD